MTGGAYQRIAHSMRRPMAARPDTPPNLRKIVRMAVLAPSSHNSQPWKFRLDARTDAEAIERSAGAAIFVAAQDARIAWVEIGRAYERLAT